MNFKDISICYTVFMFSVLLIMTIWIPIGFNYKYKTIPAYKVGLIEHNLESTPIYDILIGDQCEDYNKTSNILGYYFGYDEGFAINSNIYSMEKKSSHCDSEYDTCSYFDARKDLRIEYKYFKGNRLCTSKRPNKNYFDYLDSSIDINEQCKNGTKKCGKLDINRILCVKETENCPINDIVYNNQQFYISNNINYTSIKLNSEKKEEYEYIHYTNEQIDNFIITNLTIIGGEGIAVPCGSNDNDKFTSISEVDINKFCEGENTTYKYYYFNELSSVKYRQFFYENNLSSIDLDDYRDHYYYKGEKMSLSSTGYFSLSEEDLKILKKPSDINNNHKDKYEKIRSKSFKTSFICIIILGVSFVFSSPSYKDCEEIDEPKIIINCYVILMCLIIIIGGIIQMVIRSKLFLLTSYMPDFIFNDDAKKIKNQKAGLIHFSAYLCLLIFQIPFLIINIYKLKLKNLGMETPLITKNEKSTELSLKEKDNNTPNTEEGNNTPNTPQPSDFWEKTTQN